MAGRLTAPGPCTAFSRTSTFAPCSPTICTVKMPRTPSFCRVSVLRRASMVSLSDTVREIESKVSSTGHISWSDYRELLTPIAKKKCSFAHTPDLSQYASAVVDAILVNMQIDAMEGDKLDDLQFYVNARCIQSLLEVSRQPDSRLAVLGLSLLMHASKAKSWAFFMQLLGGIRNNFRFAVDGEMPPGDVLAGAAEILDSEACRHVIASILHLESMDDLVPRPPIKFIYLLPYFVRGWSTPLGVVINVVAVPKEAFLHLTNRFALACLAGHEEAHYQMRALVEDENASSPEVVMPVDVRNTDDSVIYEVATSDGSRILLDATVTVNADMELGLHFELVFVGEKFEYDNSRESLALVALLEQRWESRPTTFPLITSDDLPRFDRVRRPWNRAFAFEVGFYQPIEL